MRGRINRPRNSNCHSVKCLKPACVPGFMAGTTGLEPATSAVFVSRPVRNAPRSGCALLTPRIPAVHQRTPQRLIERHLPSRRLPSSRFYVHVDWICKHWPVGSSTGAVAGDTRGIQTSARPSHVVFQKGCRKSNRRGGLLKRPKPCNSCHSRSQSPRKLCLLSH